jgi:hypothetical protein
LLEPIIQAVVDQFDASFQPAVQQRLVQRRPLEITGLFGPIVRPTPPWDWKEPTLRRWPA